MQFKLRTLLMSMAGIPIVLVLGPALLNWAVGFDAEMQRSFRELEYDQSLESAIHVLGEHYEQTDYFSRSLGAYKSDFNSSIDQCDFFVTWKNGLNWYYCIGIDDHGNIVLKAEGHS